MSFNDPQWGKRDDDRRTPSGQDGPPDLDAIWQNVNKRLNEMFGGKEGGGQRPPSGGPPQMPFPLPGGSGVWLAVLVAALWLASGFYIVDEGSRGVVTRFGKHIETRQPGLQWHLPFPIERAEVVPFSQVHEITIGYRGDVSNRIDREATMLTDDENIVDILFSVQWNLHSAEDFVFRNRDPDLIVRFVAETAIREVVGKSNMDEVLYLNQAQITSETRTLMQQMLDSYATGVNIQQVALQSRQPPDRVQDAFADAVRAGQDKERMENEGRAYANNVVPRAQGVASRLREEAAGYAVEVVQRAEGDAQRFTQLLTEYRKAPEVTRNRLYLDTMQAVMTNTSKIVIDQQNSNNLLYLPLDQLLQQSAAALPTLPSSVARSMAPPADDKNVQLTPSEATSRNNRDLVRNR
ncbi:MAG: FtsH protease activity modulator HflK [Burkholderiales bacterium]|jgi:membrane protease subunit HflK|nr:FtsH protease activity modulator HflK [Burkholderiales bacterium]